MDFVIWGLENQSKVHYAMLLRHMVGDAFSYLKEYDEIVAGNRQAASGDLPSDLGLVIGAITESQQLINHALESEQKYFRWSDPSGSYRLPHCTKRNNLI